MLLIAFSFYADTAAIMTRTLRVAVLECDTPVDPVVQRYGSYCSLFQGLLKGGLEDLGLDASDVDLRVSKWHVEGNPIFPSSTDVDALILTGSKHTAFDDKPWIVSLVDYVRKAFGQDHKHVIGICFGHQIIARALGGRVARNEKGWEISVDRITLTEEGKELFGKDALYLNQMHRDMVFDLPPDCVNIGQSPFCDIQGLYIPKRVLSLQAHPEFTEYVIRNLITARHEQNLFDDELYQDGMSRAGHEEDGKLVAKTMCRFLLQN